MSSLTDHSTIFGSIKRKRHTTLLWLVKVGEKRKNPWSLRSDLNILKVPRHWVHKNPLILISYSSLNCSRRMIEIIAQRPGTMPMIPCDKREDHQPYNNSSRAEQTKCIILPKRVGDKMAVERVSHKTFRYIMLMFSRFLFGNAHKIFHSLECDNSPNCHFISFIFKIGFAFESNCIYTQMTLLTFSNVFCLM